MKEITAWALAVVVSASLAPEFVAAGVWLAMMCRFVWCAFSLDENR